MNQEAGRQHVATTAAVQVHNAAGDATGRQHTGQTTGGRAEWQQPLQEQDPVSPASSSGSALDPQLFRSASGSACQLCTAGHCSLLCSCAVSVLISCAPCFSAPCLPATSLQSVYTPWFGKTTGNKRAFSRRQVSKCQCRLSTLSIKAPGDSAKLMPVCVHQCEQQRVKQRSQHHQQQHQQQQTLKGPRAQSTLAGGTLVLPTEPSNNCTPVQCAGLLVKCPEGCGLSAPPRAGLALQHLKTMSSKPRALWRA